jgi:hypothetical protein
MQAWLKIRRNQAILGAAVLVLLAAAYFLVLKPGGGSGSGATVNLPPAAAGQPSASPAPGHHKKGGSSKSTLVLTGRNPFQCVVCPPVVKSTDSGSGGSQGTTPNSQNVTSNGLYAGGAVTNVAGHTVSIHRTYKRNDLMHAAITVDNTTYQPKVGQRFAGNFKLVSIGGGCARILYGDSSFTLCA